MSLLKSVYNIFRSIIMTLIVLLVVVYVGLYVVLSVPSVQGKVKELVCKEASTALGGSLRIEKLTVRPFSEVMLRNVALLSPEGERCVSIRKVAVGIDLWMLLTSRKIVLNYAELIGVAATVSQEEEHGPLNIQFLIDALSSTERTKPSARFDLRIRNVVVRESKASFQRKWMDGSSDQSAPFSALSVSRLRIDLSVPVLRNDLYSFAIRNFQFETSPGINVTGLSADVTLAKDTLTPGGDRLTIRNFHLELPNSNFVMDDLNLRMDSLTEVGIGLRGHITPSDFSSVVAELRAFQTLWDINLKGAMHGREVGISELELVNAASESSLRMSGRASGIGRADSLSVWLDGFDGDISRQLMAEILAVVPKVSPKARKMLINAGRIGMNLNGYLSDGNDGEVSGSLTTDLGAIGFQAKGRRLSSKSPGLLLHSEIDRLDLGSLLTTGKAFRISAELNADVSGFDRHAEGTISLRSVEGVVMGTLLKDVSLEIRKSHEDIDVELYAMSDGMSLDLEGSARLSGVNSAMDAEIKISGFNPALIGMKGKMADVLIGADMRVSTKGNDLDNLTGRLEMKDLTVEGPEGRKLRLNALDVRLESQDTEPIASGSPVPRYLSLDCDWLQGRISGIIHPDALVNEMKEMASSIFPTLIESKPLFTYKKPALNDFTFDVVLKSTESPYAFFNVPVRPLTDIPISGYFDAPEGKAHFQITTPHLLQGKTKLIRDLRLSFDMDSELEMAKIKTGLIFPAKKGEAEVLADIFAIRDKVNINIGLNPTMESVVKGNIAMTAEFSRIKDPMKPDGDLGVALSFLPSSVTVNDKIWSIADGSMSYSGNRVSVDNFQLSHSDQFVRIDGSASESPEDKLKVRLNDIDLEYIFNILNINYVSFGGMASGEVVGSRLLTKTPEARTEYLRVKGLSYNGAVLGDGDLSSDYDAAAQKVGIYGVIREGLTRRRKASINGGIWVTRDSLSFAFDADKLNVGIMKPFVSAFCSDIYGEASGKCKLYGTFSDIDLVGDLKADTLSMKLDFTNTWYHAGGDSVYLHKGVIEIPPLTLYDDEKHTAEFSGWLRHRYFHDPVFSFRLKDAKSLLCYDTNSQINPMWYGTIYGSGHAQINGNPGLIDIDMNMTTEEKSKFYYVISDAEDIAQYSFLTFTDRRKEIKEAAVSDTVPEYLKRFNKQTQEANAGSSNVVLSLKGTVTNEALVTLVMDPRAGDNITARGQGALQMDYNMANNDVRMIGTYVIDEGNYNFTLQDIIIKNFNIRKGSMIKFDGDPMNANLDIAATYRVNTNLTDLDESFSHDRELNRTNVPVDAVLQVDGPMTHPDITFDIELPSLTSDVERKVKSIVSTNDMMNRQIIYLLALNRFYTPEYTGGQSNGSEWSSMASSTISSQLSNILSQMTDKLDVAPSFRSDKGDFTDMEFDLALSSRLLNNRLLINGNFGYRDRTTSNTQFVGDFDIEYLLNKSGNLRLKAYNHFNDQNYYLRSALTTQGVGVVFRRDFDRLFRRKKDRNGEGDNNALSDSVSAIEVPVEERMNEVADSVSER